jgi:NAD(P)-dependent dehydrogenase (short-subunit alcohol dehydrogenase family)
LELLSFATGRKLSRRILITGASRGIGLALTRNYLSLGDRVTAVCRKANDELRNSGAEIIEGIDVTNPENCSALAEKIDGKIDILINNAGLLESETLNSMNFETVKQQFLVNSIGPLQITHSLLNNLDEGSKVIMITSRMGSVDDNTSGGYYGYRMSKAALNMAGKSLANDLKHRNIAVVLLHPGFVQTDMTGYSGFISPEESAALLTQRIEETSMSNSGTFRHAEGQELPW